MIIFNVFKKITFLLIIATLFNCTSRSAYKNGKKIELLKKKNERVNSYSLLPLKNSNQVIEHKYYTLSYSEKDEQAEWVAYKLTNDNSNKKIKRKSYFRIDPKVESGSSELMDYYKSGYDRGHLAPAGSMRINDVSMNESFYMSNMSPQKPKFNRGVWKRLENKVRYWASIYDSLYVVTGPVLSRPIDVIGSNGVTVPRASYKTLVGFKEEKTRAIAFIIPNAKSNKSIYSYLVSVDNVEKITNINFYSNFPDSVENKIEANSDIKIWLKK
ncbi:MAG: Nuclease [Polaribacter sp. SA4-10]|nr:MAG: Nuclease [Polaribacter sp. SA4-10]